ncbi:hypothetical protein V9T40_013892 [Parthenolecanium corni]|uniref:Uncharacterized protein n=1 Tax=Parthenolecanium corni TaxID=536013 RepID=A0AAN9Y1Q1_9HEMI
MNTLMEKISIDEKNKNKFNMKLKKRLRYTHGQKLQENFLSSTFNEIFFKKDVTPSGEQTKMKRLACRDVHLDSIAEQPR